MKRPKVAGTLRVPSARHRKHEAAGTGERHTECARCLSGNAREQGFTLLEVILAIVILATAMAILGEVARQSMRNAEYARDLSKAEMLCRGQLAEVLASDPNSSQSGTLPTDDGRNWSYTVDSTSLDDPGLLQVTVTVTLDQPGQAKPLTFSLTRYMLDPSYDFTSSSSGTDSSSGTSSSSTTPGS